MSGANTAKKRKTSKVVIPDYEGFIFENERERISFVNEEFGKVMEKYGFICLLFFNFRPESNLPMDVHFYPQSWLLFCYMGSACSAEVANFPEFSIFRPFLAPSERSADGMKKEIQSIRATTIASKSLRRSCDASSESVVRGTPSGSKKTQVTTINHVVTMNTSQSSLDPLAVESTMLKKLELFMNLREKWASTPLTERTAEITARIKSLDDAIAAIVNDLSAGSSSCE